MTRTLQLRRSIHSVVELAASLAQDAQALASRADTGSGVPARSFDANRRGRSAWCETHEQEVTACHRSGLQCDGVPVDVHDPTGEAVVAGTTAQPDELTQVRADIEKAHRHLHAARLTADRILTTPPPPKGCESCARSKDAQGRSLWSRVNVGASAGTKVTVAGRDLLDEPMALCRWCYDFVVRLERLPREAEVQAHHDGARVAPQRPKARPVPQRTDRKKGTMQWTGAKVTDRIDVEG